MSSWREGADQSPYTWAWRTQRDRGFWRANRRRRSGVWVATERETRIAAAWNAWHMLGQFWKPQVDFKFKCNVFPKQPHRAHCCQACALVQDKMEASQRMSSSLWKDARITCKTAGCSDEEKLGQRAEHAANSDQSAASKAWNCADCNGTQNPTLGMGQKSSRANPRRRPVPPASVGGNCLDRRAWTNTPA